MQVISFRSPEITTNGSLVARQVRLSRQNQQTVNGLLQIQMTLESKKKHDVELEYRFRWFNSSGLEVKTAMSEWRTLVVEARQIQPVAAVAPDATCSDYIFEVRFPGR